MNLTRLLPAAMGGIVLSATVVSGQRDVSVPAPSPAASTTSHAALVEKSCVSCHNNKTKTAGLSLQDLSLTDVPAHGEIWEKVLRKVRSGEMPPPTFRTRPDPDASAAFASFLEKTLDAAATTKPNPGRPPVHRLNRASTATRFATFSLSTSNPARGCRSTIPDTGSTTSPPCCRRRPRCSSGT